MDKKTVASLRREITMMDEEIAARLGVCLRTLKRWIAGKTYPNIMQYWELEELANSLKRAKAG